MEQDIQTLVEGMDVASTEIEAVMNANHTIVDGVTTLSQISEEISSSTQSSKGDIDKLVTRLKDFSHIVDDTFERLLHLEETASVGSSEIPEE